MKHANISIFIPHLGCPFKCSFCAQNEISHTERAPSPDEVKDIIASAFERISPEDRVKTEIAFFGGSFTAIERDYMTALLDIACGYTISSRDDGFRGIRVSTRPDCIDDEILGLLKKYGVTAIELGAQSMDDEILTANYRGHTSEDVRRSAALIKSYGFEMGLQMMTGLYRSSPEKDMATGEAIAELSPDTVRIYPTVIIKKTALGRLFEQGKYIPYPFDECISVCAKLVRLFEGKGIRIIRLGLHAERSLEENMLGGFYHPSMGELVRSRIIRDRIEQETGDTGGHEVRCGKRMISMVTGNKGANREYFGGRVRIKADMTLPDDMIMCDGRELAL